MTLITDIANHPLDIVVREEKKEKEKEKMIFISMYKGVIKKY